MAFTQLIHHLSLMMEKAGFFLTFNEELPRRSICMWTMHVQRTGNGNRERGAVLTLWPHGQFSPHLQYGRARERTFDDKYKKILLHRN
jgi:hypothetical protein